MKKLTALLASLGAVIGLCVITTPTAQAVPGAPSVITAALNATPGSHSYTFYSCTVDNRRARTRIDYTVTTSFGPYAFQLTRILYETDWNAHPAFLGNAVRLDLETNPGSYQEISPAWGGSSVTLNDMPSYYSALYSNQPWNTFNNTQSPAIRLRVYGVGAGSIGGRCDAYAAIE